MGTRSATALLALATVLAVLSQAAAGRELRIISEGARPPYNFVNKAGDLAGFEIDLAREICRRIEAACTFSQQEWEQLIPALRTSQADLIISALNVTPEREAELLFSEPYVRMPFAFVAVRDGAIKDAEPATLKDRAIGVVDGSSEQSFIEEKYKGSQVRTYASLEDAILDLAADRVDAVFGEKDALWRFMSKRREAQCCRFLGDIARDETFFGPGLAIAMRKGETALKGQIDAALAAMDRDGSFLLIRARYIPYRVRH